MVEIVGDLVVEVEVAGAEKETVTGESVVRLDLVVNTATHLRPLLTLPGGSVGVEAGVEMTAGTENRGTR